MNKEFRQFELRKDGDKPLRGILTTEQPVPMLDWDEGSPTRGQFVPEVLLMSGMRIRGGDSKLPLIDTHQTDSTEHIKGSFVDLKTNDPDDYSPFRYLDGRPQISESEPKTATKLAEGHIDKMSVGYSVDPAKTDRIPGGETRDFSGHKITGPANVRTEWTMHEASLVPIGADDIAAMKGFRSMADAIEQLGKTAKRDDAAAGVEPGGSDSAAPGGAASDCGDGSHQTKPTVRKMSIEVEEPTKRELTAAEKMELADAAKRDEQARRRELDEVEKFATAAGMNPNEAREFANLYRESGETADAAMKYLRSHPEKFERQASPTQANAGGEPTDLNLNDKEKKRYSLYRTIQECARTKQPPSGIAVEVSQEIARKIGRQPNGIFIADQRALMTAEEQERDAEARWRRQQRDLNASDDSNMVGTDHMASDFIDILRAKMLTRRLGIRVLNGLVGDVSIPRKATASSASWYDEATTAFAESEPTFNAVALSPEHLGLVTDLTTQFLAQATPDAENLVRDDINTAIALGLDAAVLNGTGTNQPMGIENSTGVETSTLALSTAPTLAELVEFETDVDVTNALNDTMAFVVTPTIRGYLRQTLLTSGVAGYMWEQGNADMGRILGYRAFSTNQLDGNAGSIIQFGDWSQYILGMWAGQDLIIDPYTQAASRVVRLVLGVMADGDTRQPDAFCRDA